SSGSFIRGAATGITPMQLHRLARDLQPPAEVPALSPRRLIPADTDRPQEPEPAQQIHPLRTLRMPGPPAPRERGEDPAAPPPPRAPGAQQPVRQKQAPGRLERPDPRHDQ